MYVRPIDSMRITFFLNPAGKHTGGNGTPRNPQQPSLTIFWHALFRWVFLSSVLGAKPCVLYFGTMPKQLPAVLDVIMMSIDNVSHILSANNDPLHAKPIAM